MLILPGDIKYWDYLDEMNESYQVLLDSQYLKNNSIQFWFPNFYQKYCDLEIGHENDVFGGFDDFGGEEKEVEEQIPDCTNGMKLA